MRIQTVEIDGETIEISVPDTMGEYVEQQKSLPSDSVWA